MSETNETDKPGAGGTRKPAAPRRTDSSSHVQQNFSHGRKNTVVVEHKTRRKIVVPGVPDKPVARISEPAVGRPGPTTAKSGGMRAAGPASARGLSTGEMDKRTAALMAERKRSDEEREKSEKDAETRRVAAAELAAQRAVEAAANLAADDLARAEGRPVEVREPPPVVEAPVPQPVARAPSARPSA